MVVSSLYVANLVLSIFQEECITFVFCCRSDLGHDIIERCDELKDLPQSIPKAAGDIMMYTKRWLGDRSIAMIAAVVPEARACEIRARISSPAGVAGLRPISPNVQKIILRQAPVCARRRDITNDAAEYLVGWCQGNLPRVQRPATYSILSYRWDDSPLPSDPGTYVVPRRQKIIDVGLDDEGQDSESNSDEDEGPVAAIQDG